MTAEARIIRALKLHKQFMEALETRLGMEMTAASREALRRLKDAKFRFDRWEDYFTAVELHGNDLPLR